MKASAEIGIFAATLKECAKIWKKISIGLEFIKVAKVFFLATLLREFYFRKIPINDSSNSI